MTYKSLTINEWDKVVEKAKQRYFTEELGVRPTRKSVAKTMHNIYAISFLEWLGLLLLLCIGVVTAFKMIAVAIPFARSFYPPDTSIWILRPFEIFMCITFILLSTSGVIYAALMDRYAEEIEKQKRMNPKLIFAGGWQGAILLAILTASAMSLAMHTSIEYTIGVSGIVFFISWYLGGMPLNLIQYLSPRLYLFSVYFTIMWLVVVSMNGTGNIFERFSIVIMEIALAFLVENIIKKRANWTMAVYDAWKDAVKPYDERKTNFFTDKAYRPILYRELREALMHLERQHPEKRSQKYRPNYDLFARGDNKEVDAVIIAEYRRHTGGMRFAKAIDNITEEVVEPQAVLISQKKRIPHNGDTHWTVTSLTKDFLVQGLNPNAEYTEADLRRDYEGGFSARKAWREGARDYFKAK